MTCPQGPRQESYDFFDDIDKYIKKEEEIQSSVLQSKELENCKLFSQQEYELKNPNIAKGICEDFIKLYKSLATFERVPSTSTLNNKDWGFLNYWLNYKLRNIKINVNICITKFYDSMEPHFSNDLHFPLYTDKMYNIKNNDFNNMKALYFLYERYIKLNNILSKTPQQEETITLDSTNDCFVDYIKARASCIQKENPYCEKIEKFKSKYQELFSIQGSKTQEFNKNFKQLPEDNKVSELLSTILFNENFHSIITIPIILSIFGLILLFFLFYKVKQI